MWRRLIIIGVLITLAILVNIAVAWGCALWSDRGVAVEYGITSDWAHDFRQPHDLQVWHDHVPEDWIQVPGSFGLSQPSLVNELAGIRLRDSFGLRRRAMMKATDDPRSFGWAPGFPGTRTAIPPTWFMNLPSCVQILAGWPWSSFASIQLRDDSSSVSGTFVHRDAIPVEFADPKRPGMTIMRPLPTRIVWPGFIANVVFYAAVLWLLVCGPGVLRRKLRIDRGRCAACAYPIGESALCTECGAFVVRAAGDFARRMRRNLMRLAVCLPVGAVVSMLAAWMLGLWSPIISQEAALRHVKGPVWWTKVEGHPLPDDRVTGLGVEVHSFVEGSWWSDVVQAGWPFRGFEHAVEHWSGRFHPASLVHFGHEVPEWFPRRAGSRGYLSLKPIWPGLIANALVWTGMLWLATAGISAARRGRSLNHRAKTETAALSPDERERTAAVFE